MRGYVSASYPSRHKNHPLKAIAFCRQQFQKSCCFKSSVLLCMKLVSPAQSRRTHKHLLPTVAARAPPTTIHSMHPLNKNKSKPNFARAVDACVCIWGKCCSSGERQLKFCQMVNVLHLHTIHPQVFISRYDFLDFLQNKIFCKTKIIQDPEVFIIQE